MAKALDSPLQALASKEATSKGDFKERKLSPAFPAELATGESDALRSNSLNSMKDRFMESLVRSDKL